MAPLPSLALAKHIVRNFERDDFELIIITGNLRKGKSSYAMKAVEQAYQYLFGKKQLNFKDYKLGLMGWRTIDVVDDWLNCRKRQPVYIWDDAGYWLHSLNWNDPLMISVSKYFNVVGTDYNTMILTTPSALWVLGKIRQMPEWVRINIVKRDGGRGDSESKMFSRKAKAYKMWRSPDLKRGGVNTYFTDEYSCKLRDDLYAEYKPVRDQYAYEAKLEIMKSLTRQSKLERLNDLRVESRMQKLEAEFNKKVKQLDNDVELEVTQI